MNQPDVVIIGAGIGGLAAALRLSHEGKRVLVLEKTDQVGGRNRRTQVGESHFDAGPTLMMMLDPFRKLFADVGETMEDHLPITLCEPSYRVFYRDGMRLEGTSDRAKMLATIEQHFGRYEAVGYANLLRDLKSLYDDAIPNFVRKNFYSPLDFAGPRQLGMVLKHGMLDNLARRAKRYVSEPKLQQLFTFQTMYLGLSPYDAPWVYAVLTYMEYGEGIWYPKGGMPAISEAIAKLAEAKGAEIRLNAPVQRIDGTTVELESGERIVAKAVVSNADLPFTERALEVPKEPNGEAARARKIDRRTYSCSAYMVYLDYAGSLPDLLHHNVFFGADFKGNLDAIFHERALPTDPAFYACVTARSEPERTAPGHENLYLLIPCANLERRWTPEDGAALEEAAFSRLESEVGFDRSKIAAIARYSPKDWRNELNLDRGAAFGLSHHFLQSAFFRPANKSRSHRGLYYVGASTQPGNGLPMVLISAELVVERMKRDGVL